jgi:ABC-type branched-subunit amino acid transport system ATPase component
MLAVARAAANPGLLWILDEPSEGLQPKNVDRCAQLIREAAARGVGVLLVEQHIGMALNVADRWLVMETGAVIDHGEVSATTHETVSRRLAV